MGGLGELRFLRAFGEAETDGDAGQAEGGGQEEAGNHEPQGGEMRTLRVVRPFLLDGEPVEWGVLVTVGDKMADYLLGLGEKCPVVEEAESEAGDYTRWKPRTSSPREIASTVEPSRNDISFDEDGDDGEEVVDESGA